MKQNNYEDSSSKINSVKMQSISIPDANTNYSSIKINNSATQPELAILEKTWEEKLSDMIYGKMFSENFSHRKRPTISEIFENHSNKEAMSISSEESMSVSSESEEGPSKSKKAGYLKDLLNQDFKMLEANLAKLR